MIFSHGIKHKNLPSLNALVAFDAAATSVSFTQAVAKLFLTQGAVSCQIRSLEENLGIVLFDRSQRKVRLTPQGSEYHRHISDALDQIAKATFAVKKPFKRHKSP